MGGDIRNLRLALVVLGGGAAATMLLASGAHADDAFQCPPTQGLVCSSSQPDDSTCFKPGATFVQQDSAWKLVANNSIQHPSTNVLDFFYVVDASRTKQNGLVFVGVTRDFSDAWPAQVRLSKNKEFDFHHQSDELKNYSQAVNSVAADFAMNKWGYFPDTVTVFVKLWQSAQLQQFDFHPKADEQPDMHARLYRFLQSSGLKCVPFYVGVPNNVQSITGTTLDVLGTPPNAAEKFLVIITAAQ